MESEQADGFPAVAESEHKQASAPVSTAVWIADHRSGAVIHLSFFAGRREDDAAGRSARAITQLTDEEVDTLMLGLNDVRERKQKLTAATV